MRIAHFTRYLHAPGGVKSYLTALVEYQQKTGHQVTVFSDDRDSVSSEHLDFKFVDSEEALFDICRNESFEIIHYHIHPVSEPPADIACVYTIHDHAPYCLSAGLFLKNSVKPCPITVDYWGCTKGHLLDHCGSLRPRKVVQNISRFRTFKAIAKDNFSICVGYFQKNRMLAAGFNPEKIEVIPNFTDINESPTHLRQLTTPEFLFIGRLELSKGVHWLLRSFARVASAAILNIAGDGSETEALRRLAEDLHIADRVNFLGWVGRAQKVDVLERARALIVPSIWPEPFGIVVAEAAAMGRPVIASDSGELPFLIKHLANGLVVEVNNVEALSSAIETLSQNAALAQTLGSCNYKKFEKDLRPDTHVEILNKVYQKAVLLKQAGFKSSPTG